MLPLEEESGPMSVELAPLFPTVGVEVLEVVEVLLMLLMVVVSRLVDAMYRLVRELR